MEKNVAKWNLFFKNIKDKLNIFKILFIVVSIVFILPSIKYLLEYKTLAEFSLFNTWILEKMPVGNNTFVDAVCFIGIFFILVWIYIELLRKDVFKNVKDSILFIAIVSVIFGVAIPYMTSDIFYYLGIGWLDSNYGENPYYSTVYDNMQVVQDDEILNSTGYWSKATCVYGPMWQLISKCLSIFSFGSVTLGIYVYKLLAIIVHLLNCVIIYSICKKKKFVLLYGLNPMILFHMITNVHNDIYVILFLLLTIYFIKNKKNIWKALTMLAISVTIKYFTLLFFPFLVLYYVQDKKIYEKFLYGIMYFIYLLLIISIPYLFYVRDLSILKAMLVQGDKYSQSIWCLILTQSRLNGWEINIEKWKNAGYVIFIAIYFCILVKNLFSKKIKWKDMMQDYNVVILMFIFLVPATFQVWYLIWLMPAIMWLNRKDIEFYNNLILISTIPLGIFIYRQSDGYIYGMWQSTMIIIMGITISFVKNRIDIYRRNKRLKFIENKKG